MWCAAAPAPDGVRGTVRLVATYVGFVADTLAVAPMEAEAHFALRPVAMAEVAVGARRAGSSLDRLSALTTINVTSTELTRAACCNLGESFETNASVDVGYQDATTGARAIRMLGLGGQYVQMMTENVPNLRGLASTFGLSYVPGPWMDGISVSKGVGTVVNGYEAITGQIDVEYKKPMGEGTASGNVFASSAGRVEANADVRLHATPRLASMLMLADISDDRADIGSGLTVDSRHTDCSAGVFGQYTLTQADRLTLVAGLRADAHNHRGLFVTPRLHLRFSPVGGTVVCIAAGRGSRTASVMAEHGHRLASSRQWRTGALFVHERAWNAGIGLTQYVDLWGRELTAEYYRTQFGRRLVPDFDSSARTLVFVADGSRSFSNTVQLEARWQPLRGLDLDVAWRLNDARQTTAGRLRSTPLQSRYKALLAASYATPLHKWQADVNVQLSGAGRIPTTHGNPEPYRRPARFGSFGVFNAQLTRFFRHCSVYAGAENIGSVMQHDTVVAADDPFGPYFDGTLVWGPLMGRRFYAGFRFEF